MATGGTRMLTIHRRAAALVGLLAVVTTTLVTFPQAAQAATLAGSLTVSPASAIVAEAVTFNGSFPSRVVRPVQLQVRKPAGWTRVVDGRTATTGTFKLRAEAPTTVTSAAYRVVASATRVSGRSYTALRTPVATLATVPQQGHLSTPDHSAGPETFTITASFTPVRANRVVTLQRQSPDGLWATVRTGAENAEGQARWQVDASGKYQAIAASASGATQVVAGPNTVRELGSDEVWLPTDRCRKVVWVGARGSAQGQQDFDGLGEEVQGAWQTYRATLHDVDAGFHPVTYPAAAADGRLLTSETYRKVFAASIDSGVASTLEFLRSRRGCTEEHYVLAGFSQGAIVAHRALFAVTEQKVPENVGLLGRIDGVLAIADGDKRSAQGGHVYGTADPDTAYGISWAAPMLTSSGTYDAVNEPVPNSATWPSARYHDVCLRGDFICDHGTAFLVTGAGAGIDLHSNAYRARGTAAYSQLGVPEVQAATADLAATTQSWVTPSVGIGPAPVMRLDESTACTQPTVTLDNTLGLVSYDLSIRATPIYANGSEGTPSPAAGASVAKGQSGYARTLSLEFLHPTRVYVQYLYSQAGVPLMSGAGDYQTATVTCPLTPHP